MTKRKADTVLPRLATELFEEIFRRESFALPFDCPSPVNLKWARLRARFTTDNGPLNPGQVDLRHVLDEWFKTDKANLCGYVAQRIDTWIHGGHGRGAAPY